MKILLVEDEVHKRDEIIQCVDEVLSVRPEIVDGVSSAVLRVLEEDYDLIILDMALSTFGERAEDLKKGHDQAQGGIEVLRALKMKGKTTKVVIVTQYPDFYIGSAKIKLKNSPKIVKEKYDQDVLGAVLYHYKSKPTLQRISMILRMCK
ncbi:CheY-like chemotaxis protein [Paraburkholderia bannensis]|uniref:CheY-like chemotaxis protein n=1 Tax=Paraburkholderia bannensis TaxID=765414 RepID=A0A7W9U434_9BURK|nr:MULTISPECIES: response regulator [Paraburkholderia]MBB3261660.1 CheY-like chemotaxis protein [Paraburkholderia sp. WP4_3_2]MBB6106657.1 CheY-like chemotaxis protein [Paraburkholderia bannensis]